MAPPQSQEAKKPGVKRTSSYTDPTSYDIVFTGSSGLEVAQNVGFVYREPPNAGPMNVANVLTLGSKRLVDSITLKILPGGAVSSRVQWVGGPRERKQFHVCDRSGQTRLTLWEEKILMVKESTSYLFTNLTTRKYGDRTTLSSTRSTTITETEDAGEPATLEPRNEALDVPKICGRVIGADITARHHCGICRGSQAHLNEKTEGHRCEKCNMLQRRRNFRVLYGGKLCIANREQNMLLTVTNSAVCMFIDEQMAGAATDTDAIAWKLACAGQVELTVDSTNTVTLITVAPDNATCSAQAQESHTQAHEREVNTDELDMDIFDIDL